MTTARGRARGLSAVTLAVVLAVPTVVSCGIPNMDAPAGITLATPTSRPPVATPSDLSVVGGAAELFLVAKDNKLVPVRRAPIAGDTQALVIQTLSQLTAGPDTEERARGLSSAIPPGLTVMLVRLIGTQAIVDIEGTDPGPATDQAVLATGQVVLTLTALPEVDSVLLTRNGRPQAVLPDGELTHLPLTRDDFTILLEQ